MKIRARQEKSAPGFVLPEDGQPVGENQMSDYKHVALLSDGTKLSQEEYEDILLNGSTVTQEGRVLSLWLPEFYGAGLWDILKDNQEFKSSNG